MPRWHVIVPSRVNDQIKAAPLQAQFDARKWIAHLAIDPFCRPHAEALRSAQRKNAKGEHIRLWSPWRLVYVVLPNEVPKAVYVYDVVAHVDDALYSVKYIRAMLREARKKRNPVALAQRIHAIVSAHPEWGNTRIAQVAECAANTVRLRRAVKSGITLPWLHAKSG